MRKYLATGGTCFHKSVPISSLSFNIFQRRFNLFIACSKEYVYNSDSSKFTRILCLKIQDTTCFKRYREDFMSQMTRSKIQDTEKLPPAFINLLPILLSDLSDPPSPFWSSQRRHLTRSKAIIAIHCSELFVHIIICQGFTDWTRFIHMLRYVRKYDSSWHEDRLFRIMYYCITP